MPTAAPFAAPIFQPLIDRGILAGVVVLAGDRGGVRAVESLGFADLRAQRSMTDDTMFWIASTSKAFTGTLLMMLIEAGDLHPDDPIESYLPEFKGQMVVAEGSDDHLLLRKPARPIILRDCVTHVSGLPFRSAMEVPTLDGLPLAASVRSYAMSPLLTEPGTKYLYSNAGTNTAARLIEVITGQAFENFLRERLLDPLGLGDTTFWPDVGQVARLAQVYKLEGTDDAPGELRESQIEQVTYPLSNRAHRSAIPAGGLFSTARDLAVFGRMIANFGTHDGHQFLTEASVREMTAKHTPDSIPETIGYLWNGGGGWWGHGGACRNQFGVEPKSGVTCVIMVQSTGAGGKQFEEAAHACRLAAVERFGH